ncbi:hypothetical protein SCLCIDRAFT_1187008 [Scleroderma citrinum Foug A]|uniref:Uncharacterized protein n=1 Tax=Scleroderma citrinum Foug A TaxID=1036808 RepID=A0A0C3EJA3_9AGAM|nr:hypothetical protein SCLCIDRAFT_1187008 [Scleroderma citrinum Foug A]
MLYNTLIVESSTAIWRRGVLALDSLPVHYYVLTELPPDRWLHSTLRRVSCHIW